MSKINNSNELATGNPRSLFTKFFKGIVVVVDSRQRNKIASYVCGRLMKMK